MTNSKISPQHYSKYKIQPIDFIQANELDFAQGNIIKYVLRYKDKNGLEDLQKAKQNIDFLIKYLEKANEKEPY
jgi:translation initiation factor 2B subunit (eIF-2B alpha/beta/delta family)